MLSTLGDVPKRLETQMSVCTCMYNGYVLVSMIQQGWLAIV
jgi:hypothetical protein